MLKGLLLLQLLLQWCLCRGAKTCTTWRSCCTWSLSGVWKSQPEGHDYGKEKKVGDALATGLGPGQIERLVLLFAAAAFGRRSCGRGRCLSGRLRLRGRSRRRRAGGAALVGRERLCINKCPWSTHPWHCACLVGSATVGRLWGRAVGRWPVSAGPGGRPCPTAWVGLRRRRRQPRRPRRRTRRRRLLRLRLRRRRRARYEPLPRRGCRA